MSGTCQICGEPAFGTVGAGPATLRVCMKHDRLARETGKELVHTAARMAGSALEKKAPLLFETGKAVFVALKLAQEKNGQGEPT